MRVLFVDFCRSLKSASNHLNTRLPTAAAAIFLGSGHAHAQDHLCGPQLEYPSVQSPDSSPTSSCDGVGQIVENLDEQGVLDGTYRWETRGYDPITGEWTTSGGVGSQCWSQLFLTPNYYTNAQPNTPTTLGGDDCDFSFYDQYYLPNNDLMYNGGTSVYPFGFRTKFNPLAMPGPGTFLPPADTIAESSVALVPPAAGGNELSWNGASRATLHDQVDLVTGLPLQQANELELPFGGATFRLMRTRSGSREDMQKRTDYSANFGGITEHVAANERWWDWAGQGWMVSENPLLLVDSAMPGPVGPQPVTTYLMLDAHHTIPFQRIESTGQYAAPPRFRARLDHNGEWLDGDWTKLPTQYDIYLYDGELKYSFVVIREDIPDHNYQLPGDLTVRTGSYHERPLLPEPGGLNAGHSPWGTCTNPGLGIPYLGICFKIEDRYGHEVRINYSDVNSQALDMTGTDCVECSQSCQKKGMISSIELVSQGETIWTLVYSYRGMYVSGTPGFSHPGTETQYPGNTDENAQIYNDLWGGYHINQIHVVDRPLSTSEFDEVNQGLTLDHRSANDIFQNTQALDLNEEGVSAFADIAAFDVFEEDWVYRVRNHYMPDENGGMWRVGLKVMTTVTERIRSVTQSGFETLEDKKRWVYHYNISNIDVGPGFPELNWPPAESSKSIRWLSRMYTPDDVDELIRFWMADPLTRSDKPVGFAVHTSGESVLDSLVRLESLESTGATGLDSTSVSYASGQWTKRIWADWSMGDAPDPETLLNKNFVTAEQQKLHSDNFERTVRSLTVRDETGKKRKYQISRIRMSPFDADGDGTNFFGSPGYEFTDLEEQAHIFLNGNYHQMSVFYAPFKWLHVMSGTNDIPEAIESPNLMEPRWIVIVDELPLDTAEGVVYGGEHSIKDKQLSRRVVEMSASGHVLTDKLWEFTDDGVVRSGGGLGEQFIYMSAEDYFALDSEVYNDFPPAPTTGPDDFGMIRTEPLMVEYRSVGYSVDSDKDVGLTRFIDYKMFNPVDFPTLNDYSTISEREIPLIDRIQPVAEGIRQGVTYGTDISGNPIVSVHPKLYKSQTFRSASNPLDVTGAVEYAELTHEADILGSMPAMGIDPSTLKYRVLHTVVERDSADPDLPEHERDILSRMVVGVPKQVYPNSPFYYPVEREFYDPDKGHTVWSCSGLLKDPSNPTDTGDPYESLTFTYYERDGQGRSKHTVLDAVGGITVDSSDNHADINHNTVTIPSWPIDQVGTPWMRIGQTDALQYVTSFKYHDRHGLVDVFFPSGRRWAKRVIGIDRDEVDPETNSDYFGRYEREFIFNDLEFDQLAQKWFTHSEGEVNDSKRDTGRTFHPPIVRRRVRFNDIASYGNGNIRVSSTFRPEWEIKNSIKMVLDSTGRLQEARLLERSASGQMLAVGTKQVNDLGALYREQEMDGTVTIQTRNAIGQTLRVYKGTVSGDPFGIGAPGSPDNMRLMNRTQYGSSANDAWLPTVVRRYDMFEPWHTGASASSPYEPVSDALDMAGMPTTISYDWQNRAVRTDTYARGVLDQSDPLNIQTPRRLSTTLTYLDYSDRPYLEVVYGADSEDGTVVLDTAGIDPTGYVNGDEFPGHDTNTPDVGQFVRELTPLSVSYTIYSLNNTTVERRQYDPADLASASPQYQASYNYNGLGGQQIYSQSPGAPIGYTILDSVGRVSSELSMSPNSNLVHTGALSPDNLKQLTRTDYTYDTDGNVTETVSWVRTIDDVNDELSGSNAVRNRSLNWYNAQKRLIASAELGTENEIEGYKTPDPIPNVSYSVAPTWNFTTGEFDREGLPEYALINLNEYDEEGNLTRTVDPKGIATAYEYSKTNRLLYKTENADAPLFADRLMTAYRYQYGRMISMSQVTEDNRYSPIGGTAPPALGDLPEAAAGSMSDVDRYGDIDLKHSTGVVYGAEVVQLKANGYEYRIPETYNNSLVGALHLPDATTGEVADDADVLLRYTTAGHIAERFDAAGGAFRYLYDELDRLISIETGSWDPSQANPPIFEGDDAGDPTQPGTFAPNGVIPPMDEPTDKIRYIEYIYDDRSGMAEVIAWTARDGPNKQKISHSSMDYDMRGMLLAERQGHGAVDALDLKTPATSYEWSYEPTSNTTGEETGHHRLASIEYPVPSPNVNSRKLTMQYGAAGSLEDLLSRISGMNSDIGTVNVADFTYTADGRRSSIALKNGRITNDHRLDVSVGGLDGHDVLGRMTQEHWKDITGGGSATLYKGEYGFDAIGNRITAYIQQVDLFADSGIPGLEVSRDNVRSTLSAYDDLNRLVSVQIGQLGDLNGTPIIADGTLKFDDSWNLDAVGNWVADVDPVTGAVLNHGRESEGFIEHFEYAPGISTLDSTQMAHMIDQDVTWRDSISVLTDTTTIDGVSSTIGGDPNGVVPIYDGAGRLRFDGQYSYQYDTWGRLVQINRAEPALTVPEGLDTYNHLGLVKHYVYDGLGRLIRTTSPIDGSGGDLETVDFFYDGVRRIQEIINEPVVNAMAASTPGSGLQGLASQTTTVGEDTTTATMGLQGGQLDPELERNIHREYVWGPGDGGVDEILLQSDETDEEYWCIQDSGGDLVAMAKVDGQANAQVVRQWTYGPYGEVLTSDHLGASIESHIGHKGLFLDRIDEGAEVTAAGDESPRLVPDAHASYHNRNRTYQPTLGRFLQMDPNASGLALMSASASHGSGMGALSIAFSMQGMLGDGMNLYQYLGGNPWQRSDPMGLSWDPFSMVDEYIAEWAGSSAAFMDRIGQSTRAVAVVAATIAAYLPFPGVGIAGQLALAILNGETLTLDVILESAFYGILPAGAGKLAILIKSLGGKIFRGASKASLHYGVMAGARPGFVATMAGAAATAGAKFLAWLNRGPKDWTVYLGYKNGAPVYVGITKQGVGTRRTQHNQKNRKKHGSNVDDRFDQLVPIASGLTHKQALALEQFIYIVTPSYQNERRPMSSRGVHGEFFDDAVGWAGEFFQKNNMGRYLGF